MFRFAWASLITFLGTCSIALANEETALKMEEMPFQKESLVSTGDFAQTMLLTVVILAVVAGVLFLVKKRIQPTGLLPEQIEGRSIQVIQNKRLTPKTMLTLVEVGGKEVLVATHKESVTMVELSVTESFDNEKKRTDS